MNRFAPLLALAVLACARPDAPSTDSSAAVASAARAYVPATAAPKTAFTAMTWIIGSFRGEGAEGTVQSPFFERYSLANDSTLVVEGFADSTMSGKPDSSQFELRGDSIRTARYAASVITPDSIVFSPRAGANNAFTWRRGDATSWIAIITPVPTGTLRTYKMTRLK